jgi:hypothetical protein
MAFIRDPMKNKDDGDQSSGVIGTDGQQITGDQAGAKPVSNWTNLNAYIDGNQGAGSQIADKMLEQGNQDVSAAEVAGTDFARNATKQVDDSTKQDKGFANYFTNGDLSSASPEQKAAYSAWKNQASYGGPADASSANGYNDAFSATQKAKDSAARSYTQDSQFGLTKDSVGKGNQNYNGGMSMLDTILARQAGGGQKIDDFNAKNSADNIQSKLKSATESVNTHIGGAAGRGQVYQDAANTALQSRLSSIDQTLSSREAANKADSAKVYHKDHSRADYASNEELSALDNLINGFGATTDAATKQDLLNKSGVGDQTYNEYLAREVGPGQVLDAPNIQTQSAEEVQQSMLDKILSAPKSAGKKISSYFK